MARQVNQVLWDQWRKRLDRFRGSRLSIAEFCRKEGVSPHRFHVWRRKVRDASSTPAASPTAPATRPARRSRTAGSPPRRSDSPATPEVPTRSESFLQLPVTTAHTSPWIELTLADGTVVRLPQQNLAALVTVLQVLRGEHADLA
jgi:transposase-like protein